MATQAVLGGQLGRQLINPLSNQIAARDPARPDRQRDLRGLLIQRRQVRGMKRLECLDGLRGVLAVYVMLGHMAPFAALPAWMIGLLSHGGAAVDVFFILSGLVILRSLESCGYAAHPFLISRVARIFPVYLAMLAAGIAVQPLPVRFDIMPWIGPDGLARDIWSQGWPAGWPVEIAAHVTMIHGMFPNGLGPGIWVSFLGSAWSLSTEWQFYGLALLVGRARMGTEALGGVGVG